MNCNILLNDVMNGVIWKGVGNKPIMQLLICQCLINHDGFQNEARGLIFIKYGLTDDTKLSMGKLNTRCCC